MNKNSDPKERFFYSGKIADYLEYKGITKSPVPLNYEEDEPYADDGGWSDNQGGEDRRS